MDSARIAKSAEMHICESMLKLEAMSQENLLTKLRNVIVNVIQRNIRLRMQ
ncbi:hypothetical protein Erwinia_phage_Papaline_00080 [Erwinia phage Papaline]|nr:hypothetical protein Erwinia_phage_Papaline_00080 [Erwinia phage Papaline]